MDMAIKNHNHAKKETKKQSKLISSQTNSTNVMLSWQDQSTIETSNQPSISQEIIYLIIVAALSIATISAVLILSLKKK